MTFMGFVFLAFGGQIQRGVFVREPASGGAAHGHTAATGHLQNTVRLHQLDEGSIFEVGPVSSKVIVSGVMSTTLPRKISAVSMMAARVSFV